MKKAPKKTATPRQIRGVTFTIRVFVKIRMVGGSYILGERVFSKKIGVKKKPLRKK